MKPVSEAQVELWSPPGIPAVALTGGTGEFTMPTIGGKLSMRVSKEGFIPVEREIVLTTSVTTVELMLTPITPEEYRVGVRATRPGSDVLLSDLRVTVVGGAFAGRTGSTTSHEAGVRLPAGSYTLHVEVAGHLPVDEQIEVTGPILVIVRVQPEPTFTLTVSGIRDEYAGVVVEVISGPYKGLSCVTQLGGAGSMPSCTLQVRGIVAFSLTKPGYQRLDATIDVSMNRSTTFALSPASQAEPSGRRRFE
jgi:hypothetical protein